MIPQVKRLFILWYTVWVGEGNGNLLQCSCLENPRDGGAWWAAVSGVAQSPTRLKRLSSSSSTLLGFPCGLAGKESACSAGDLGSIPGLGRSPGEGKGYPLLPGASMGNPTCGKGHEEGDLAKGKG